MDTIAFEYGFLGIIILMIFFAFLIGTHKMLQVIVSTTCISLITLWWSWTLSYLSYTIAQQNTLEIFGFWSADIASFVQSAEITTSVLIFVGLLIYAIQYASSSVMMTWMILQSKLVQFLLSPLAIFSMIISLSVAVLWIKVFSLTFLQSVLTNFGAQSVISLYVQYLPLGILIQGLITLLLVFQKEKKVEITYDDI